MSEKEKKDLRKKIWMMAAILPAMKMAGKPGKRLEEAEKTCREAQEAAKGEDWEKAAQKARETLEATKNWACQLPKSVRKPVLGHLERIGSYGPS
jgi:hypothetical protein